MTQDEDRASLRLLVASHWVELSPADVASVFGPRRQILGQPFVGEPLLFARVELRRFSGEPRASQTFELVGQGRLVGLASIPESTSIDQFVDPFEQVAVDGDFGFGMAV